MGRRSREEEQMKSKMVVDVVGVKQPCFDRAQADKGQEVGREESCRACHDEQGWWYTYSHTAREVKSTSA